MYDNILNDTFLISPDIFRTFVLTFFSYKKYSYGLVYYAYVKMHVEGNRRAFCHVHDFKTFVDELYSVRMYEDQT